MKWEHTRAGDFDKILEECGYTCIVPIGSLEPHGHHMPVGTDYFTAKATAERGKRYTEMAVKNLADAIRNVKENTSAEARTQAYYDKIGR